MGSEGEGSEEYRTNQSTPGPEQSAGGRVEFDQDQGEECIRE